MKPNTENGDDSEEAHSRRTQAPKPNLKSRRNRSRIRRRRPPTHQTAIRLKTRVMNSFPGFGSTRAPREKNNAAAHYMLRQNIAGPYLALPEPLSSFPHNMPFSDDRRRSHVVVEEIQDVVSEEALRRDAGCCSSMPAEYYRLHYKRKHGEEDHYRLQHNIALPYLHPFNALPEPLPSLPHHMPFSDDRQRSFVLEEIEDVVVSKEALRSEAGWLGRSGDYHVPKKRKVEHFIERPLPLDCEITRKGLYTSSQKILLVGEGDFSFSACLAEAFGSATNLVATSLDSWELLCQHYKSALWNIPKLTDRGCAVLHGIDATKIAWKYPPLQAMQFDRIIFNFPHAGVFKTDAPREAQLQKHQRLIRMFLANAKVMIKMDGEIHIRHKSNGFFRDWNIQQLGENEGLRLIEAVPFHQREYEGYNTKFGFGGNANGNFDCNPSNTYRFGLPFNSLLAFAASIYYF
ncbi:hypothetical protein Dimus_027296 [Dionaea muscipula]